MEMFQSKKILKDMTIKCNHLILDWSCIGGGKKTAIKNTIGPIDKTRKG